MAENKKQNTLLHKRSVKKGVLPQGEILQYGEIAVNYNSEEPFLSIRKEGENKDYAKFSADEVIVKMFDAKYATIKDVEENEEVVASALNGLNDRIDEIESKQEINIGNSKGEGSLLQKVEAETFVDETPDSSTNGQDIPTEASGNHSVVLNGKSKASGKRALAQGNRTIAYGDNSHTEGHCTQTLYVDEVTNGYAAHAEGYGSIASGTYSHAEGNRTVTSAPNSHAEGYLSITTPEAESSHAEGYETTTEAPASHTEGNNTKTHKAYSHAEGRQTETFGEASHTEGNETITEGDYAHAEGWMTRAKGAYSHAEGQYTFTYADAAHSEGNNTHAQSPYSHTEGIGTKTNTDIAGQHAEGYYNSETDATLVVGCGTGDDDRKNAFEVKQDGRILIYGIGNFSGTNSYDAVDLKTVVNKKADSDFINTMYVKKNQVATIVGNSIINGGDITLSDLGLAKVLKYCGITTTVLTDNSTTNPIIIDGKDHTAEQGNIVFYEDSGNTKEFVFNGTKWELLGSDLTYKVVQTAVSSPNANGDAVSFIDTISQDANGVITATKKNVKIPTPDWNANEGEAGYIENRTHYKHITNAELECITHSDESSDDGQLWRTWGGAECSNPLKIDRLPAEIIIEGGGYRWAVTLTKVNTLTTLDVIEMDESVNIAKVYLEEYEGYYYLIISDQGYDNHILDGTLNVTYNEYIPLNENYIPNTIARKSDIPTIPAAALKYCGITTTKLTDGDTTNPVVIDSKNHTAEAGCVVFYEDTENGKTTTKEFVFNGTKWELLGSDLTYKVVQNAVSSPNASGSAMAFIDTISQDANGVITATKKNVDMPIVKGDVENSAVLDGEYEGYSNKAISQTSMAIGAATTAGLKGWYYSAIDFTNNIITLSDKQPKPVLGNLVMGGWSSGTPNIKVGDKVSIVNNAKYDYCGEVQSISGNKVTLKSALPFDTLDVGNIPVNNPDDWTIYLPDKPDAGIIDFGGGALAEGVNAKATNIGSHAEGIQTHAYGQYSHTEGFKTTAGYAAHAEGKENKAIGGHSHAEGELNEALSYNSHAEGYGTKAGNFDTFPTKGSEKDEVGRYTHSEGRKTAAKGSSAHAEGYLTAAIGKNSHAEGEGTITKGRSSHSSGYNTLALANYSHTEGHSFRKFDPSYVENLGKIADIKSEIESDWDDKLARNVQSPEEGRFGATLGECSHIEGITCITLGNYSHAEGEATKAKGRASHTEGEQTVANNRGEHACGRFNVSTESTDKAKATQFSIGIGTSSERKNAFEVKQNGDIYIEGVEGKIQDKLDKLVNITYLELKTLRDNSKLIPGQQYRITDYITTTTQSNTQSAGHQFDIIVTADDVNVLNENARAIQNTIDENDYFHNSNLNAWELKYCLDNDTNSFAWADATNGKGVIYYMKDEFNNECPYDFKNIQFARWELSAPVGYRIDFNNGEYNYIQETTSFDSLKTGFCGLNGSTKGFYYVEDRYGRNKYKVEYTISESPTYCYTFGKDADYSINGSNYDNVIKEYKMSKKIQLNNIVFLGNYCFHNSFGIDCRSNSFGGKVCQYNSFGNNCHSNSFESDCVYNSFGNSCSYNSFGSVCQYNSLGNYCFHNSFGKGCSDNSFGIYCNYNSFGNNCHSNSFESDCVYNSFGNYCDSNSFGIYCNYNSFGDSCIYNSFGNSCSDNSFGESKDNLNSYYRYIIFDNGNRYINLNCTTTTTNINYFQNVRIGLGVNNTDTYKTINDSNVGQTYETLYRPSNSQTITI